MADASKPAAGDAKTAAATTAAVASAAADTTAAAAPAVSLDVLRKAYEITLKQQPATSALRILAAKTYAEGLYENAPTSATREADIEKAIKLLHLTFQGVIQSVSFDGTQQLEEDAEQAMAQIALTLRQWMADAGGADGDGDEDEDDPDGEADAFAVAVGETETQPTAAADAAAAATDAKANSNAKSAS